MRAHNERLALEDWPTPEAGAGQIQISVLACGVCRTDLHVVDGDLGEPALPLIPGHQIVGRVVAVGPRVEGFEIGDRVGVPWLGGSCGACVYCVSQRENLCDDAVYTGYQINGGMAEVCVANAEYSFKIPDAYDDLHAAPLLCAGLIGYRSLRMAGDAQRIGLYGFGASAHIMIQLAAAEGREVSVFTRAGDSEAQRFAERLGATWVGNSDTRPPTGLDAAIIFAPVGRLVPAALGAVEKGGTVVCAGIHMSDIPSFPYSLLWGERVVRSVANLTRRDGEEFFAAIERHPVTVDIRPYPLEETNEALADLRAGRFTGAAVIDLT